MNVTIQAINFVATEKLKVFIDKKAERLQRHHTELTTVDVKMTVVKPESANNKEVVLKAVQPSNEFVATKTADTFEEAIDLALDALSKMLEKTKDKK